MKTLWHSSVFRRTALALMGALLLAVLVISQVILPAQAQGTNLALRKPVTCSSTENASFPCANAVDGSTTTRWSSAFSDPQWIQVDLNNTYRITSVVLNWEAAYGRAFRIEASNDLSTWTQLYSTTTGTGGTQTLTVTGFGRYVRLTGTTRATQYGYSLFEFQVYGYDLTASDTPPTYTPTLTTQPPTTNLALNRPVTFSNQQTGNEAAKAVDGSTTTRWAGSPWPQWIQVDLGGIYGLYRTELMPYMNRAYQYRIEVSSNGSTYTTVVNKTSNTTGGATLTDSFPGIEGRYVRLVVTGASGYTGGWVSFYEFRVFGGGTPTPPPPTTPPPPVCTAVPCQNGRLQCPAGQSCPGGCGYVCVPYTPTPTTSPTSPTPTRTPTATPTTITPPPTGNIMLSYQAPAFASSFQNDAYCVGCSADKVVDMDMSTRWASAWSDPQWIYLDLGASANIKRVVLKWQGAFGKSYQIQVSSDASSWSTIYTTTTSDGATDDLTVSGSGRYVRIYGTVRGTGYGYSLFEFEVYGTGGAPKATPTPRPTATPHGPWVLAWSDEFNGPGIDTSNWNYETGCTGYGNGEWENYTNGGNSSIAYDAQAGGNVMIIEARQTGTGNCGYTSSRMTTAGKREFTYGRIEARLKLPQTQGIWPAFWMMGNNINTGTPWPYNGEIDIMEHIGKPENANITSGALHGPGYSGGGNIGGAFTHSQPVNLNYHVYAIEWSPDDVKWFVDSNNFLTVTRDQVQTKGQWVFDHPFFILLNVAVGGAWPGYPDGTSQFPQRMYVDYVRVYQ